MASELGDYLRACRARVRPDALGPRSSEIRRVPGARREEIGAAAGISPDYYTRIEQGRVLPSYQVLSTLAAALGLDEVETEHLQRLARGHRRNTSTPARHHVRSEVAAILGRFDDLPALVLGRSLEALAWTPVAVTLLGLRADRERNMARRLFLCPDTRRLYPDWPTVAAETVAHLRRITVQHPLDPATTGLVVELSCASEEFAELWSRHEVSGVRPVGKRFDHPLVGRFELRTEVLTLPEDQQRIAVYDALPGTPGVAALARLRALAASAHGRSDGPARHGPSR